MLRRTNSLTLVLLVLLLIPTMAFSADYSSLLEEKARAVVPIKFTVKMTVTRGGESNTRELSAAANGVLVNRDGLLLMSARQLKGAAMFQRGNRPNISFETVARDFKARMPDGSWMDASLAARDEGLDLAFVRIEESVSGYDSLGTITFPERPDTPTIGQEVIHVSRSREGLNFEPHFLTTRVNARITDPRLRLGLMDGAGMLASYIGSPGFDTEGNFVGLATFRSGGSPGGGRGGTANPYANMSKNQQFLLPTATVKTAIREYESR